MATQVDPLQALQAALRLPTNSKEQADQLGVLREALELRPGPIPLLCTTLIKTISSHRDTLLEIWVLELVHYAICRSPLSIEVRTQLAADALDTLASLLYDSSPKAVKIIMQTFSGVYSLLFRSILMSRNRAQWDTLQRVKFYILDAVGLPSSTRGVKLAAVKFMQRVILVQTRGIPDPRLQNKNDPNISSVPLDHPVLSASGLENEGVKLLQSLVNLLYQSQSPDILSAIFNSWSPLPKLRPNLLEYSVTTLTAWKPDAISNLPISDILSVERTLMILLNSIRRYASAYGAQINQALTVQSSRVRILRESLINKSHKRAAPVVPENSDAKRQKLAEDTASLASFDFTKLPVPLITELIVKNLAAMSDAELSELVGVYRASRPTPVVQTRPSDTNAVPPIASISKLPEEPVSVVSHMKLEPLDPLEMIVDEGEIEYEPDEINQKLSGNAPDAVVDLQLIDFKIPPPRKLEAGDRDLLVRGSLSRIWSESQLDYVDNNRPQAAEMWMLLVVRMVTRVAHPPDVHDVNESDSASETTKSVLHSRQDQLRQILCDYVMADFAGRIRLAISWMNEEWYNDRIRMTIDAEWRSNYEIWLNQLISAYQTFIHGKDTTFSRFLSDLPSVPAEVLGLLRDLCVDPDRFAIGFNTLYDFVVNRPGLRAEALNILLELTTHPEKRTRLAAINLVRRWVPHNEPMNTTIQNFALQTLRRLQRPLMKLDFAKPFNRQVDGDGNDDERMEDGQMSDEDFIPSPYLEESIELPAQQNVITQHVELLFGLTVKVPDLLEEVFNTYPLMEASIQEAVQELVTGLIKALGSSNGKLLTLMRTCPRGAESLALRILTIFTDSKTRPSPQLVTISKALISERDLDARFLVPIVAEMDKADIIRHLPRVVSTLNGQAENRALVRSVFSSIVTTPPQGFGTVSSNLPRVRQSELLTPAELMVLLHDSEKEIGVKAAIEAIGICFSMTDVYTSEVLGVVMQQIVDRPVLPILFLRTIIQAVTTYSSLKGFVSQAIFPRLIIKKIWTSAPLWEGFIRCAKVIGQASFATLLQLPKDQLRDLVDKQPTLKAGLRDFVTKKAGNKSKMAGYMDILGDDVAAIPANIPEVLPATPDDGSGSEMDESS